MATMAVLFYDKNAQHRMAVVERSSGWEFIVRCRSGQWIRRRITKAMAEAMMRGNRAPRSQRRPASDVGPDDASDDE
jgi:hypothetical protein